MLHTLHFPVTPSKCVGTCPNKNCYDGTYWKGRLKQLYLALRYGTRVEQPVPFLSPNYYCRIVYFFFLSQGQIIMIWTHDNSCMETMSIPSISTQALQNSNNSHGIHCLYCIYKAQCGHYSNAATI